MSRHMLVSAAIVALVVSGCGDSATRPSDRTTGAPAPTLPTVPRRDRFVGTLRDRTGALAGAREVVEARLQTGGSTGIRHVTLWIASAGCRPGSPCVQMTGSLGGQLVPVRSLADIGRRYAITVSGSLHPLGATTAAGTITGPGNIAFGFESLRLTLHGKRGSAQLTARSGRVPGFTSP